MVAPNYELVNNYKNVTCGFYTKTPGKVAPWLLHLGMHPRDRKGKGVVEAREREVKAKKLNVFDDIRKEHWYKPKVLVYADMISMLASNNLFEKVEMLCLYLKMERNLEGDTESFNALLRILMEFGFTRLVIECFRSMKAIGYDPDESMYRFQINGLESNGETGLSSTLKQEAEEYFGWPLELQEEEELLTL
ncbi:hypothetical protein Syun_001801 [Stephania yunnanensis]|uniref:Pentatricopeptide repeat-containing protein n=1 Tax=Stephania yunnanensis TaxID=152371 RepID=A0AAP0QB93_9MAGN